MKKYDPKKIEAKWQKYWQSKKTFVAKDKGPKEVVLIEFPYPSGAGLHMGHMRPFIAGDVVSKYWRLRGKSVMYPIGWDAFGLPAENFAIKNKIHPSVATKQNIKNAKKQLLSWGTGFDWNREINTTDPSYYKWTQKLFLEFYKSGLAYEKFGEINWCPKDKTGLANEEVIDGKCDRCGSVVEKKSLRQWYLKITDYAEKLLEGLKDLPEWPNAIKTQQENWIGKSEGAEIDFKIAGLDKSITVFTTRADTLFGVTYVVLAPEHELVQELKPQISNWSVVEKYIEEVKGRTDIERGAENKEKTGVELKGVELINPANSEHVPVWIADYALVNYGTGAVMAVPAHDERDFEFAKKYNLPIKSVVAPKFGEVLDVVKVRDRGTALIIRDSKILLVKEAEDNYLLPGGAIEYGENAKDAVLREVTEETGFADLEIIDYLGSHRLYWHSKKYDCNMKMLESCYLVNILSEKKSEIVADREFGWFSLDEAKQKLSDQGRNIQIKFIENYLNKKGCVFAGEGELINSGEFSGLLSSETRERIVKFVKGKIVTKYKLRDWVFSRQRYWGEPIPLIHCSKCGIVPVPEKDLPVKLPNVKNYEPTGTGESPLAAVDKWVNTKCPQCKGKAKRETNTMPQWAGSSWYWMRYMDPKNKKEFSSMKNQKYWSPVDLYFGGMEHTTLHLLYSRFWNLFLYDRGLVAVKEPYKKRVPHGIILGPDGEKMSKSRGNVVNPDELVKLYGADTVRLYMMFLGPHGAQIAWNDKGIIGARRFIERVWAMQEFIGKEEPGEVTSALHKAIKKVTEDMETFSFNTAVSAMMIFANTVYEHKSISRDSYKSLLIILSPFIPHATEEIWASLKSKGSIYGTNWPKYDDALLKSEKAIIAVQINGKVKAEIEIPQDASDEEVREAAMANEKVRILVEGREVKKAIVVKNRLINIVII